MAGTSLEKPIISNLCFVPLERSEAGAVITTGRGIVSLQGERLLQQQTDHWIHWSESQGSFEDTTGWERMPNGWRRDNWECWSNSERERDMDVTFDSSVAILGNQSFRNHLHYTLENWHHPKKNEPGKGIFKHLGWLSPPDSDQYYYRYYVRYSGPTFKWTNNSFKQFYLIKLFNMNPSMGDKDLSEDKGPIMYDLQGRGDRIFVHLGERMELERWYCIELMVRKMGTEGIEVKFWLDGKPCNITEVDKYTPLSFPWKESYRDDNGRLSFKELELGTVNCQNWTFDQLPVDQNIWFDGFALSTKRRIYPAALVEIGDHPNYQAARKITPKIIHLSDQEIKFQAGLADIAKLAESGNTSFSLWVTNNREERSNPYSLDISSWRQG